MKKISVFLVFAIFLCGCSAVQQPVHPVVTTITITVDNGARQEVLTFDTDAQTSMVLTYLRLLDFRGPAQVNPAYVAGTMYEFCIFYSDGSVSTLRQKGERYFMGADGVWLENAPYSGSRLARLLHP